MKNNTYENFVDGIITFIKLTLWVGMLSMIGLAIFSLIFVFVKLAFVGPISMNTFEFMVFIMAPTVMAVIPTSVWWFYYRRARKIKANARFRDFWIGFATVVSMDIDYGTRTKIKKWLNENARHMFMFSEVDNKFWFASKTDAVAFKLQWDGDNK